MTTIQGRWLPWLTLTIVVAGGAVVQGATATPGYAGTESAWFWVAVAGSVLALLAEAIALPWAAGAIARGAALARPTGSLIAWAAIVTVIVLLVAVLAPLTLPAVWALAIVLLAGAATGRWNAFAAFRAFARHPWGASLALLTALVVGVLGVVVALTSGVLLTGFLGGLVAWAWIGVVGAALLGWWTRLLRAEPAAARAGGGRPVGRRTTGLR